MLVTPGLLSTSRWLLRERAKPAMKTGDANARRGSHSQRMKKHASPKPSGKTRVFRMLWTFSTMPKWRGQDLNLRPRGYEPRELPDCSTPRHECRPRPSATISC